MKNFKLLFFGFILLTIGFFSHTSGVTADELFTINYPVGDEEFTVGEQVTIEWEFSGIIPQVYLAVLGYSSKNPATMNDSCAYINLTPTPIANNGSFVWTVQVDKVDGGTNLNCKFYKVVIYKAPDFATADMIPGFFTVKAGTEGTTTPPIIPTTPVDTGAHPAGTNVKGPDGTIYRIESYASSRSPYTSAGAFTSYKFNTWAGVVNANSADLALPLTNYTPSGASQPVTYFIPPKNGSLIVDNGTVYLITGGLRAAFTSAEVFTGLGYSFKYVYPGDTSFMQSLPNISDVNIMHPEGTLINEDGTLYVMRYGTKSGFPDMGVLDSWGIWAEDAVPANTFDRQAPVGEVLRNRMVNQMNI